MATDQTHGSQVHDPQLFYQTLLDQRKKRSKSSRISQLDSAMCDETRDYIQSLELFSQATELKPPFAKGRRPVNAYLVAVVELRQRGDPWCLN